MRRQPAPHYDGPTVPGIDVSHWQGGIDWKAVARDPAGYRFAIVRTGDGKDRDRRAVANLAGAQAAGLLVGAYHYIRAAHSPERQLEVCRGVIEEAGVTLDLPLCPDLEGRPDPDGDGPEEGSGAWKPIGGRHPLATVVVLDCVRVFAEGSEEMTGIRPWIYTGVSWHWYVAQKGRVPDWASRYPLWLPSYSRRPMMPVGRAGEAAPWREPLVWQHTSRGTVAGIAGNVDLNEYRGTLRPSLVPAPPDVDRAAAVADLAEGAPPEERAILLRAARELGALRRCV